MFQDILIFPVTGKCRKITKSRIGIKSSYAGVKKLIAQKRDYFDLWGEGCGVKDIMIEKNSILPSLKVSSIKVTRHPYFSCETFVSLSER